MLLFDYIGNRALEELEKKFKTYLNEKELQKILLECFKDAEIIIDDSIKREILDIDSEKIKPNMSKEEIEENLKVLFSNIIDNNEEYYGSSEGKKDYISSEYLKRARKDILELHHILEVLDDVKADMKVLVEASERQEETSKKVDDLYNELHLINELDDIRVYYYFRLEVVGDFQDNGTVVINLLKELLEDLYVEFKVDHEDDAEGFYTLGVQFFEPVLQKEFRIFLSEMNDLFSKEGILISKITSHF